MTQPNIPSEIFKQMQEAMRSPEGTFCFQYHSPDLFSFDKPGGILVEIPAGKQLIRLERDDSGILHFYHSSPGTGTRDAQIDLKKLPPAEEVFVILSWSPEETKLNVGPKSPGGELVSATGSASSVQFRVGDDGGVYSTGNQHIKIMGLNIFKGGKAIIEPTALDTWKETVQVMEILATGQSTEGYIYEVALASSTIVLLVTGFEAYARKRFIELEEEGVNPNMERLFEAFFSNKEREAGIQKVRDEEAQVAGVSTLKHIVGKREINFQNYEDSKKAFNKVYGIKFGEIGVASRVLEDIQRVFKYRHKLIHVSALPGILNQEQVPPEEPIFLNKAIAEKAKGDFQEFIDKLHKATFELRG